MRKILSILLILALPFFTAHAHIGSPDVIMEGNAGPYRVLVSIKPPDVIPGVANVTVYIQSGATSSVYARAIYFYSGESGAPPAEMMSPVTGTGQYTSKVWLMDGGSSSIQVTVNGSEGKGVIVVPIVAMSTAQRDMPSSTGWILAVLGAILFLLMITIIGSSVSDALIPKGESLPLGKRKMRLAGMITAALLTSLIVYGGNAWWQDWANDYRRFLYKPTNISLTADHKEAVHELKIALDTTSQNRYGFSYVVPDHGKLMHMFIMRIPAMDAFAHLHPIRVDSANFRTILPSLPKGKYIAFADIVYSNGFTETMKDTFDIAADITDTLHKLDPDDAYAFAIPAESTDKVEAGRRTEVIVCGKPGTGVKLKDGSSMVWEGQTDEAYETGKLYQLTFAVLDSAKQPAKLDSYLGMAGHAAIIRSDGNVYSHIHPGGTYSMSAENSMLKRIALSKGIYKWADRAKFRDSIDRYEKYLQGLPEKERENILMQQMNMTAGKNNSADNLLHGDHGNTVAFSYSFPSPGQFRIWVQVKRNGKVLTGAFDKMVK